MRTRYDEPEMCRNKDTTFSFPIVDHQIQTHMCARNTPFQFQLDQKVGGDDGCCELRCFYLLPAAALARPGLHPCSVGPDLSKMSVISATKVP